MELYAYIEQMAMYFVLTACAVFFVGTVLVKTGIINIDNATNGVDHDEDADHPEPPKD